MSMPVPGWVTIGAAGTIAAAGVGAAAAGLYRLVVSGALTLDLDIGRRRRALGPFDIQIAATPDVVFDVIAGPYLGRTPRAVADKLKVMQAGTDMVLAEHYTPIRGGLRATTLETVRFTRPVRVEFRLVRGPAPLVIEAFTLEPAPGGTRLAYNGDLAADGWAAGRWWAEKVGSSWEQAVRASFVGVKAEAERRTTAIDPG